MFGVEALAVAAGVTIAQVTGGGGSIWPALILAALMIGGIWVLGRWLLQKTGIAEEWERSHSGEHTTRPGRDVGVGVEPDAGDPRV